MSETIQSVEKVGGGTGWNDYRKSSTPWIVGYVDNIPIYRVYKEITFPNSSTDINTKMNNHERVSFDLPISKTQDSYYYRFSIDSMSSVGRSYWNNDEIGEHIPLNHGGEWFQASIDVQSSQYWTISIKQNVSSAFANTVVKIDIWINYYKYI